MSITALQGRNAEALDYNWLAIQYFFFLQRNLKMMKIQAVVIVNVGAETDAEKAIDNSETENQMQTC